MLRAVAPAQALVVLLSFGVAAILPAQDQALVAGMTARVFESPRHGAMPYRWFAPAGADRPLPLVVFLHGAGERGDDNRRQLTHGVRTFLAAGNQQARPCFVAAPQCPRGRWWDAAALVEFTAALAQEPGVDPDRLYLTGLSMGGFATWHVAGERPDLFAAALPVCGGGRPETALGLSTLPIWAFHGDADRVVAVDQSRTMIDAIRSCGGTPDYTEYPGIGHDSWTRTYADAAVHEWLFAQRRVPRAPLQDGERIVFFGDSITAAGTGEAGFIRLLEADLRQRLPDLRLELVGAGRSGDRVPDLLDRLDRDVLAREPTRVVVYIGINDVWHHQHGKGTPRAAFETGLRELLQRIRAAGVRVLLCTPSVIGEKPDGSNEMDPMLDDYAALGRMVAAAADVGIVDLRRRFVTGLSVRNRAGADRGVLTSDGVHLNETGNRFVADALLAALGAVGGRASAAPRPGSGR